MHRLCVLCILLASTTAYAVQLGVQVPNLHVDRQGRLGRLIIALCDNKACYDNNGKNGHGYLNRQRQDFPVKRDIGHVDPVTFSFNNLSPGTYSVTIHHDRDSDGKTKTATCSFGKPRDGVGFSNNVDPRRLWRKPRWNEVKVELGETDKKIKIRPLYMCD